MPAWDEYKETARARGALAFELFVVESTPAAPPEQLQATLPDHLAYQKRMEAAGHLFLAGPLSDESGSEMRGSGLIVYRAASFEEARSIADEDPMHATGTRTYVLRKWLVNEGSPRFSTTLSDQKVVLR
ncbi:MAG: YciI family protein [Pseudomonadota bacterium]